MPDQPPRPKRKPGRPPVSQDFRKNTHLAFRVRDGMREKLQVSAESRGLSISEEVERRLDLSLDMAADPIKSIAIRMIAEKWRMIDALVEEGMEVEDPYIYARMAADAVVEAVDIAKDPALLKKTTGERIKGFYTSAIDRGLMGEVAARHAGDIEGAAEEAVRGAEDHDTFRDIMDEHEAEIGLIGSERAAVEFEPVRRDRRKPRA